MRKVLHLIWAADLAHIYIPDRWIGICYADCPRWLGCDCPEYMSV